MKPVVLVTIAAVTFASVVSAEPIALPTITVPVTGALQGTPQPIVGPPEASDGGGRLTGPDFQFEGGGFVRSACDPVCLGETFTLSTRIPLVAGTIAFQGETFEFDVFQGPFGGGELTLTAPVSFGVPAFSPETSFTFQSPFALDSGLTIETFLAPPTPDGEPVPATRTFRLTGSGTATGTFSFDLGHGPDPLFVLEFIRFDFDSAAPIPEPGSLLLLAGGVGVAAARHRRKEARAR